MLAVLVILFLIYISVVCIAILQQGKNCKEIVSIDRYQAPVHARRKNTSLSSDYQKRNPLSHPAKKNKDAAEKKHMSQRKEQMPKSKRFRSSQDKGNTNYVGKF